MSRVEWRSHHSIVDGGSDRVDGEFVADGVTMQLDVSSLGDECCTEADRVAARRAWESGTVFLSLDVGRHGVPTLVVPELALTGRLVVEAVNRFRP